jgi:hypothetical protein
VSAIQPRGASSVFISTLKRGRYCLISRSSRSSAANSFGAYSHASAWAWRRMRACRSRRRFFVALRKYESSRVRSRLALPT